MTKPIRLVVITTHPIQYIVPWFRSLAEDAGIELKVLFFREPRPYEQGRGFGQPFSWDIPLREGYNSAVLGVREGPMAIPSLLWKLVISLRLEKPDIVLVTGWNEPGLLLAYPLLQLLQVPVLCRGEANHLRRRSALKQIIHRMILTCIDGFLAIGRSNEQFYRACGVPTDRIFSAPYFVEANRIIQMRERTKGDRDALRSAAHFTNDDVVFCFVGKHVPFKRPDLLVRAAAIARRQNGRVKLLLAGSGEMTDRLKSLTAELGVPAHFTGFLNQSELWKAYAPSDVLVLPSTDRETWGLVANEAMLFGLPVIVSDEVGCGPDLVLPGQTGLIFSGGVEELASAMCQLALAEEDRKAMGRQAFLHVSKNYDMTIAADAVKRAAHRLVGPSFQASDSCNAN